MLGADRGISPPVVIETPARGGGIVVAVVGGDGGEGDASGCRMVRLLDL